MNKFALAAALALVTPIAFAQTCTTPANGDAGWTTAPASNTGNTCGASDEFAQVCGGGIFSAGPSNVWKVQVGDGNNFTVTVTPTDTTYDTALFLVGPGACGPAAGCPTGGDADNAGAGDAETLSFSGIAAGTYYIVVDSTAGSANTAGSASCGNYSLAVAGTLPVELKSFSIN